MVTQSLPEFSFWRRPTPPAGSRIRPEGVANYERNRGTIRRVFQQVAASTSAALTPTPQTPRPLPRCPTSASRANYTLGVKGTVSKVLDGSASFRPATAPPRVKPEAEVIATLSQGVRIKPLIHELSSDGPTPRVARVKPEAQGIAEVSKGHRMEVIIHEFGQHGPTPRQPRVKAEAEDTAQVAKGGRMHNLLHKYGTLPLSARAVPRVKPEGQSNAALGEGKRMDNIIHKYGRNEVTPRPPPRVKSEAQPNAQLARGQRMATLVHSSTLPRSPRSARPPPRVKPEAARSAELGRGFRMALLIHDSGAVPATPRPATRAVGQEAKRNWWQGVVGSVGQCLKQAGRRSFIFTPGLQARRYSNPRVL